MSSVTLHVYDLSHGMARQLSPALLGKVIDGVWHTGVLVFGKEYFFGGGGIQAMAPELVVQRYGMNPIRTVALGETSRSLQELEQFLRDNSARFTDATYDLLRHNCNNFSDEVSKFLVGSGIPQYILDLPNEALNSPFGAMLRPMLENMNNQMHAAPGDQLFSIPFNDPSRANLAVPAASPTSTAPTAASSNSVNLASRRFKISGTPALHLDKMVKRVKALNTQSLLSDDEVSALEALSAHVAAGNQEVDSTQSEQWWKIVKKLLAEGHESSFFFAALGLSRVLLLQPANASVATEEKKPCFEAVVHVTEAEPSPLTAAQKTLLLAVLLNAFANPGFSDLALSGSTRFLPFVFATITDPSTSQEARVLSSHIISNCCLALEIGEEVVVTTIVCGAVETLDRLSRAQTSSSVQHQTIEGIIVGLGRLLNNFEAARSLSVELGLAEVIRRLNTTPGLNAIQPLLSEFAPLLPYPSVRHAAREAGQVLRGRHQAVLAREHHHQVHHEVQHLPAAHRQRQPQGARALLPGGAHVQRRAAVRQGARGAEGGGQPRHRHRHHGHEPARREHPRGRGQLGLRHGRRLLRGRHGAQVGRALPHVLVRDQGAAGAHHRQLPRARGQALHHGPLHGRPRRPRARNPQPVPVQVHLGVCAHFAPEPMPVGYQGFHGIPGCRPGDLEGVRRDAAYPDPGTHYPADSDRPGWRGQLLARQAAAARGVRGRLQLGGPEGDAAHAGWIRPQLLLHRFVRGGPHQPPRGRSPSVKAADPLN